MQLRIENINKSFGKKNVLKNINLKIIDEPRFIALIAPNGSGKTTLLNIICNIEKSDSGHVEVFGLANNKIDIFKKITYMQDNSILYPDLTGMDHIRLVQELHQLTKSNVSKILRTLKMTDYAHKQVKYYSLGMKQHLLFALSILPKPKILLMDEPLNGLDPASVVRVRRLLLTLHKEGSTIIFSSHNLDQIDKLTNDIYFLRNQQLVSLAEIEREKENKNFEVVIKNSNGFYDFVKSHSLKIEVLTEYKYIVHCSLDKIQKLMIESEGNILEYQERKESLEKIYFELYEDYEYDLANL